MDGARRPGRRSGRTGFFGPGGAVRSPLSGPLRGCPGVPEALLGVGQSPLCSVPGCRGLA
ncbi:hypothetical protein [Streptomyces sp. NBC_01262]|uniref:hypothetical protein n=1 Tax=Streptomyces sp. NBC_01262 TaxID=2903803 RepID=UPI002E30BEE2|nr:hypothetical protein [Streptomyces sp. NBC_01262]